MPKNEAFGVRLAKRSRWSKEQYRDALLGDPENDVEGLRALARGVSAAEGFNLREFEDWTPAQKRKVRVLYERARLLEQQPRTLIKPRSEEKLRKAQRTYHRGVPSKDFKVAWVQTAEPHLTLRDARENGPKIDFVKDTIVVHERYHDVVSFEFDQEMLAIDVDRALDEGFEALPDADIFYGATADADGGLLQMLNGATKGVFRKKIKGYVQKYDGVTPLTSGRHRGDNPESHYYGDWLVGMFGYRLKNKGNVKRLGAAITKGRAKNIKRKQSLRNKARRKGR